VSAPLPIERVESFLQLDVGWTGRPGICHARFGIVAFVTGAARPGTVQVRGVLSDSDGAIIFDGHDDPDITHQGDPLAVFSLLREHAALATHWRACFSGSGIQACDTGTQPLPEHFDVNVVWIAQPPPKPRSPEPVPIIGI